MKYQSVDSLQKALASDVFHYASDQKKAAGRALGTLVEIIAFYTLQVWGLRHHIVIERAVPEFANPEIIHNVEFSLHPIRHFQRLGVEPLSLPLTPKKIGRAGNYIGDNKPKTHQVISRDWTVRNACVLWENPDGRVTTHIDNILESEEKCLLSICELSKSPFAIVECKRVGVEEGMKKGPQTIEKAKQGAYVALSVSSMQKIRRRDGLFDGIIEKADGSLYIKPYDILLEEVIHSADQTLIDGVILTIGIVSNHGNWFTSENHNKELKVLAQSYDWLLFLTDSGLAQFIESFILNPSKDSQVVRETFLQSYSGKRGKNRFTKVKMDWMTDLAIRRYFHAHIDEIGNWYNVISPKDAKIAHLRNDLAALAKKNGRDIQEK